MSSADSTSLKFLKEFKKMREEFGSLLEFKPHFVLWFCYPCRTTGWKDENNTDCVSGGRYCAPRAGKIHGKLSFELITSQKYRIQYE